MLYYVVNLGPILNVLMVMQIKLVVVNSGMVLWSGLVWKYCNLELRYVNAISMVTSKSFGGFAPYCLVALTDVRLDEK